MNTTSVFNPQMFQSIKDALKQEQQTSTLKDILKLEAGATYQIRIIPNINDPTKTFYHYYNHGWKSLATGQFVSAISPTTWGERDPIAEERFSIAKEIGPVDKTNPSAAHKKLANLNRKENWLANVYVVVDPKHPENVGKIKILRFGRQLHKIIMDAIEGDDAAELGARVFDLTSNGCNLKIKAEQQGEYTTFVSSKFGSSSEIPGLTPEKMKEVYNSTFDLTKIFTVKSYDELKKMLDEHYYANKVKAKSEKVEKVEKVVQEDSHPDLAPQVTKEVESTETTIDDAKVQELLKELN